MEKGEVDCDEAYIESTFEYKCNDCTAEFDNPHYEELMCPLCFSCDFTKQ